MTPDMASLLWVVAPIALLDSTSITPLCIVPLIMLLSGKQPILRSSAFLLGIFATGMALSGCHLGAVSRRVPITGNVPPDMEQIDRRPECKREQGHEGRGERPPGTDGSPYGDALETMGDP